MAESNLSNENNYDNSDSSDDDDEIDDDDSLDEIDNSDAVTRSTRSINESRWPPDSNEVPNNRWRNNLRHVQFNQINQPKFGNRMQLHSRTRYNVGVYYDEIKGTQDDNDLHTYLELISAGPVGYVRIMGMLTNHYVGMDEKGRLYAEPNPVADSTIFIESVTKNGYNVYLSKKYQENNWYLGIKKNGKFKRGSKTAKRQKAVQFLPRRGRFQ